MDTLGLKRTIYRYLDYYQSSIEHWWDTIGPVDYMVILSATLLLGWILLKGNARAT
jgi:hypothetical protein